MYFAEYYEGKRPMCGDRSVFVLDGRNTLATQRQDAVDWGWLNNPRATHFRIMRGESFTRSSPITDLIPIKLGA